MKGVYPTLVKRELWEHRWLWLAPLVTAGILIVLIVFGVAMASSKFGGFQGNWMQQAPRGAMGMRFGLFGLATQLFSISALVVVFYLLDCLYAERKDRSILFWKSLPVSDTEVVLSKLLTAAVVTPVFVLLVSSALQVLFAGVWSIRFSGSVLGDALMAWDGAVWLKLQASFVLLLASGILWYLPILTYLMVVSVWARRNAFLWAVLPPVSILAIEGLILQSNNFGHFLGRRFIGMFQILQGSSGDKMFGDENEGIVTVGEVLNSVTAVFTHYETWAGVLAAAAMIFAAIRIRRYRDDN